MHPVSLAGGPQPDVVLGFPLDPAIKAVPDGDLRLDPRDRLNQICDISDWRIGPVLDKIRELNEPPRIHRKAWELAKCIIGLERLGVVREDALGLSVGAGAETAIFYLANKVGRMVATDLYESETDHWESEADHWGWGSDFLRNPEKYAAIPYREDHLEVLNMSGLDLKFEGNTFDFAYTLSSIEHFGGHEAARQSVREMARVVKPSGIVCVVTELQLDTGQPAGDPFTPADLQDYIIRGSGLELVEPTIDLRISESLLTHPVRHLIEPDSVSPHIVLTGWGGIPAVWTSIILFFTKPK
ncbi:MAG: class I SAM-dependent methyltransferase [Acidimicrobiaceae bacterium]|nr:class I SAM-dependent methyltransferase [Acidimicrobiaceae bacterium]